MAQSQAQWDAIVSIESNTPFASSSSSQTSTVGAALDSMLSAYDSVGSSAGDDSLAAITQRVRAAQQSTIDLFA